MLMIVFFNNRCPPRGGFHIVISALGTVPIDLALYVRDTCLM